MLCQTAVIGQQQQAFAQIVEPADRIDSLADMLDQVHHRRPAFGIGNGCDMSFGLVEQEVNIALPAAEQLAVHFDVIVLWISLAAQFGNYPPVHSDAALCDQLLSFPSRGNARGSDDFLQSLAGHSSTSVALGISVFLKSRP